MFKIIKQPYFFILILVLLFALILIFLNSSWNRRLLAIYNISKIKRNISANKDYQIKIKAENTAPKVSAEFSGKITEPDKFDVNLKADSSGELTNKNLILIDKKLFVQDKTDSNNKWFPINKTDPYSGIFLNTNNIFSCVAKPQRYSITLYRGKIKGCDFLSNLKKVIPWDKDTGEVEIMLKNNLPKTVNFKITNFLIQNIPTETNIVISFTFNGKNSISAPKDVESDANLGEMTKRDDQRKRDLQTLKIAIENFSKNSVTTNPLASKAFTNTNISNLPLEQMLVPNYLKTIPQDPIEGYSYYYNSQNGVDFNLRCILENKADPKGKTLQNTWSYEISGQLPQGANYAQ